MGIGYGKGVFLQRERDGKYDDMEVGLLHVVSWAAGSQCAG